MHRATYEVQIGAPPARVWDLVARFEAYPTWTRWLAITGEPRLGEPVDYAMNMGGRLDRPRRFVLRAEISRVELGETLALRFGVPGLHYELSMMVAPGERAARLEYVVEIWGLFSGIIGPRFARMMHAHAEGLLADAKRRLEGGVRPKTPAPPKARIPRYVPPPPRKKGRRR